MEYFVKDFEQLLLNVYSVPQGENLYKAFPILAKYKEFNVRPFPAKLDKQKLIRYIVYSFDRNSPLHGINDVMERRVEACILAGFSTNSKGEWPEYIDMFLRSQTPKVNHMVIRYCIMQANTDWAIRMTYEDALIRELKKLMDLKTDDDPSKIISTINNLRSQIYNINDALLSGNVDQFLTRSLIEMGAAKILELSPEYYAEYLIKWNGVSKYYKEVKKKVVEVIKPK